MLSKIITATINGMDVKKIMVETDFLQGLPFLSLVGLPDATVRESKERIKSAIINSGYVFPLKRITINLSPADTRKTGSHFDLPMAVGILKSMEIISDENVANAAFLGELSLDGSVNAVEGCVALALGLKEYGIKEIYLPSDNIKELTNMDGVVVYGISRFNDLIEHFNGIMELKPDIIPNTRKHPKKTNNLGKDYSDVYGQESGKRAMQICAAGWHDIMMIGPPGSGKTMLADRIDTLMTDPTEDELVEITKIHSIAGEPFHEVNNGGKRPFRSPHHSATSTSIMGGGYNSKPGELSLAHRGVLFLDELPEFDKKTLDMLRQPLEDGYINVARLAARHRYPCRFILIAAMNPCPCGYYGDHTHECTCNTFTRTRYMQRISGPLKDRFDIHLRISPVDFKEVSKNRKEGLSSSILREKVLIASEIQDMRYRGQEQNRNSQVQDNIFDKYCRFTKSGSILLKDLSISMGISARALSRIKRVSRTIADLDESESVTDIHIAEAAGYRTPDYMKI